MKPDEVPESVVKAMNDAFWGVYLAKRDHKSMRMAAADVIAAWQRCKPNEAERRAELMTRLKKACEKLTDEQLNFVADFAAARASPSNHIEYLEQQQHEAEAAQEHRRRMIHSPEDKP